MVHRHTYRQTTLQTILGSVHRLMLWLLFKILCIPAQASKAQIQRSEADHHSWYYSITPFLKSIAEWINPPNHNQPNHCVCTWDVTEPEYGQLLKNVPILTTDFRMNWKNKRILQSELPALFSRWCTCWLLTREETEFWYTLRHHLFNELFGVWKLNYHLVCPFIVCINGCLLNNCESPVLYVSMVCVVTSAHLLEVPKYTLTGDLPFTVLRL